MIFKTLQPGESVEVGKLISKKNQKIFLIAVDGKFRKINY